MQTKTVQVVMLPQSKDVWHKNDIVKLTSELWHKPIGTLAIAGQDNLEGNTSFAQSQHLCFTSAKGAKKGDWSIFQGQVVKLTEREGKVGYLHNSSTFMLFESFIEACTDEKLLLPLIPQQWIRDVYVPAQGKIKEVQLEIYGKGTHDGIITSGLDYEITDELREREGKIKLTDNNEVCIMIGKYTSTNTMAECEKVVREQVADNELNCAAEIYAAQRSELGMVVEMVVEVAFKAGAKWQQDKNNPKT